MNGDTLEVDEVESLLSVEYADLDLLLDGASQVRDSGLAACRRPGVITYSRKVFVPLTTLCRDRCHYCVFVDTPNQLLKQHKPMFMSPEQVLAVVRQGRVHDCKEALLTLGDRPEDRWPEAREWLEEHGFTSTLDYVGHIARLITAETGLLAHLNPGVMSAAEIRELRSTAPSMGMMLETTSRRLFGEPGQVHYGSPDKDPSVRLRVIEDAGRAGVPFTTGILVGIGETTRDRAESLVAIRDAQTRHGHVQEVIVQNFRAKPRTAMQDSPDAGQLEYIAAVAVARLVMGPHMRIQVPPNLSDPRGLGDLVRAGVDDWGGVSPLTADHVNPERPWPHLDELARLTSDAGFALRERLTVHPKYATDPEVWLDPAMRGPVAALVDRESGLARDFAVPTAAAPHVQAKMIRESSDADARARSWSVDLLRRSSELKDVRRLAEHAADDPLGLDDAEWRALLTATGAALEALIETADDVRRYTVGEAVSLVVNRNLTSSGYRSTLASAAEEFTLRDVGAIARDAADLGATELCVQGRLSRAIDPSAYLDIARAVKAAVPDLHLHAYRPQDVWDFAARSGFALNEAFAQLCRAGVDTVPGTGVKILSERVRRIIAPEDLDIARWTETVRAAHDAGVHSTSVLFYGHVESAAERIAHLRTLRRIQGRTAGFTEFVPIPFPGPDGFVPLVRGRLPIDEHRAMTAVSRLMLSGSIPHIQIPWTRVGRANAATLLRAGADDLGGTLLDGRVRPETGAEYGQALTVDSARAIAASLFRPFRLRTTEYGSRGAAA